MLFAHLIVSILGWSFNLLCNVMCLDSYLAGALRFLLLGEDNKVLVAFGMETFCYVCG